MQDFNHVSPALFDNFADPRSGERGSAKLLSMAQRRMFSPDIVSSDAFLDMPASSQALYFHLGMSADDDGFVNPKRIIRGMGASDDDLKVLLAKRFLLQFEGGVVVIKHWLIHNLIRSDRYKPTQYLEHKKTLYTKENKAYTDMATNGLQIGNQMAPQVRLGKVSKTIREDAENNGELVRETTDSEGSSIPSRAKKEGRADADVLAVFGIFSQLNPAHKSWGVIPAQRNAAKSLLEKFGVKGVRNLVMYAQSVKEEEFAPQINSPYDLFQKLTKLKAFRKKQRA